MVINIRESYKNIFTFNSKLVNNNKTRKKGLMNRKNLLKENEGMLFDFVEPQVISLWMKNTYIPLDAIYFNKDGKILAKITSGKWGKDNVKNTILVLGACRTYIIDVFFLNLRYDFIYKCQ